jgi:predicted HAD superfamily Cof-like phosphohydrolase
MDIYDLVKCQLQHFNISYEGPARELSVEERRFRTCCMLEEVTEYLSSPTLEKQYDSLLDLLVFAIGTMVRQGFPIDGIVDVVQANLRKELGPLARRGDFELDLIKPDGWVPADLSRYLKNEQGSSS